VIGKEDFRRFFRFDDYWGTHRGFFWNRSFEVFGDMNFFEKLFGAGPETFYFKFEPFFAELTEKFNESSSNSAHNVYINYLLTHGIVGLAAYLTFIGGAIVRCFKNAKENPLSYVCLGVIAAYITQDFVNIANPTNTPWLIVFIAISEACVLRANRKEQLLADNF
ncbi:MAG: O-antigen ligase family protein, partial [Ruminococcus sp.]|nr:O-antigen ligase family protein [Ruminococcus sp.]